MIIKLWDRSASYSRSVHVPAPIRRSINQRRAHLVRACRTTHNMPHALPITAAATRVVVKQHAAAKDTSVSCLCIWSSQSRWQHLRLCLRKDNHIHKFVFDQLVYADSGMINVCRFSAWVKRGTEGHFSRVPGTSGRATSYKLCEKAPDTSFPC